MRVGDGLSNKATAAGVRRIFTRIYNQIAVVQRQGLRLGLLLGAKAGCGVVIANFREIGESHPAE